MLSERARQIKSVSVYRVRIIVPRSFRPSYNTNYNLLAARRVELLVDIMGKDC